MEPRGEATKTGIDRPTGGSGERLRIAVVFGSALILRLASFLANRAAGNPLHEVPVMDALYHDLWARDILAGNWIGDEIYFRAPLYPYLLALVYRLGAGITGAILVQHVLGALSTVLVYLLARRSFAPRVALVAGLLAAAYWPFLHFEGDLLIVTLVVFLDILALLLLTVALQGGRRLPLLAGGFVLGLSAITRPSILIFLPCLPIFLRAAERRRRAAQTSSAGAGRSWITHSALCWLAALVPIAPVLARNWAVGHDFVPIASQGGVNFWIGNNPDSDGVTAIVPGTRGDWMGGFEDALHLAEREAGRPLEPSGVSRHYFRKGLEFVFGSPAESLPLFLRKLRLFWGGAERSNNKNIYFFWEEFDLGRWPLPLVGFGLIGPLGLVGLVLLARRDPELGLLACFVLSYMLGVVAFFVNARFRLPVVPALIVFAAGGAFELGRRVARRRSGAWKELALALGAFALVNADFARFRTRSEGVDAISLVTVGNAYKDAGRPREAIAALEQALELNRGYRTAAFVEVSDRVLFTLGRLYWGEGQEKKALSLMERGDRDEPRRVQDKMFLAACYGREGRRADAVRTYEEVLRLSPSTFLRQQVRLWRARGELERAELALSAFLEAGFEADPTIWTDLAEVYEELGSPDQALEARRRALERWPQGVPEDGDD